MIQYGIKDSGGAIPSYRYYAYCLHPHNLHIYKFKYFLFTFDNTFHTQKKYFLKIRKKIFVRNS